MASVKAATTKKAAGTKKATTAAKTATKAVAQSAKNEDLIIKDDATIASISKELNKRYPYLGILFYDSDPARGSAFGRFGMISPIGAIMPTGKKRTITVTDNMLVGKLTDEIQTKFGVMAVVFCKHIKFDAFEEVSPFVTLASVNKRCEKENRKQLKLNEKKQEWIF